MIQGLETHSWKLSDLEEEHLIDMNPELCRNLAETPRLTSLTGATLELA